MPAGVGIAVIRLIEMGAIVGVLRFPLQHDNHIRRDDGIRRYLRFACIPTEEGMRFRVFGRGRHFVPDLPTVCNFFVPRLGRFSSDKPHRVQAEVIGHGIDIFQYHRVFVYGTLADTPRNKKISAFFCRGRDFADTLAVSDIALRFARAVVKGYG